MTTTNSAELLLILVSGFLGSAHCIGMCGGLAATVSLGSRSVASGIARQLLWSSGRIVTYVFLGILTAAFGVRFLRSQSDAVWLQSVFAIAAGLLLVTQGLLAVDWNLQSVVPRRWVRSNWLATRLPRRSGGACVTRKVFAQFLKGGSAAGAFVAGLFTGFLPCGLVYAFLALAVSTGSVFHSAAVMLSFGLGTLPVMLVTGTGFSMASIALRTKLLRLAAFCVIATGALTIARGMTFATSPADQSSVRACPLCTDDE